MSNTVVKSGFLALLEQVAKERNIPVEKVVESIELAIEAALRKDRPELFSEEEEDESIKFEVTLDRTEGSARIFRLEDDKREDVTPAGFGRIASQTAKNVIFQKVREFERDAMIADYSDRVGSLAQGTVMRYDGRNAIVDLGRGQGIMPPEEQMHGEFYRPNLRLTFLIKEIRETMRGNQIIVSRADKDLILKLFEREVPELASEAVEVKGLAREAGIRTKIAVFSDRPGVDPVGSCVGQRGVRVQEVIREVNNEKVDIIQYSTDIKAYLAAALSPAESLVIDVDESNKQVTVTAPDDQLPLAIGRGGQNVRLAAKLTGYQISIQSASGDQQASVTGNEEYEIDHLEGMTPELRAQLIENRLTTYEDIHHRWDTLSTAGDFNPEQVAVLKKAQEDFAERLANSEPVQA
jgi:N utilization substance protein A